MPRYDPDISFVQNLGVSGFAILCATVCTHPIDFVKVRLQNEHKNQTVKKGFSLKHFVRKFQSVYHTEGPRAFYGGLTPAMLRACVYGSARVSFFEPIVSCFPEYNECTILLSAFLSGVVAVILGNPLELLKVQAQSANKVSLQDSIRTVYQNHGVAGFWRGFFPASMRAGLLTATQIGPYKSTKGFLKERFDLKPWQNHLSSSLIAGLVSTTFCAPVDLIKTRVMTEPSLRPLQCLKQTLRREGFFALFRGWVAAYARLGPQTTIFFVVYDHVRQSIGFRGI